jgi:hypothetical protein
MFGRRRVRRVTVNIPAWIEVGDSTLLERCTLVDLTDEGAKLVVGDISHLTDHFCLYLTRRGHLSQRCRIVWRRDHQVGVEFEVAISQCKHPWGLKIRINSKTRRVRN